jgi:Spy/CpxP family protein refolding chaperone
MNQETRRTARLWLTIVFLLGAAVGVVFGYSFGHRTLAANKPAPPVLSEPERRAKRVADMTAELGLNREQSTRMDDIIRRTHEAMKAVHEKSDEAMKAVHDKCDADVDALRQKARDEMRADLTAEQKPKFEAMVQRMDEERKKQQGGR